MKEEINDVVEELADRFGIYGCECDDMNDCPDDLYQRCRMCFVPDMTDRIVDAVRLYDKINAPIV